MKEQYKKGQKVMPKQMVRNSGFTLVELMVAIALTTIVAAAVMATSISQRKSSLVGRQVGTMQENLRGSFYIMERDMRMAGFDPEETGNFGIISIGPWTVTAETVVPAALPGFNPFPGVPRANSPSLVMAGDNNQDQVVDPTDGDGVLDPGEIIAYRLFDDNNDGIWDLVRDVGMPGTVNFVRPRQLVAEGIEHMGMAFAIDNDENGELDRTPVGGNIIWAADSNWDGILDTNLDTNDDGRITPADDSTGDQRITAADGLFGNLAALGLAGGLPVPVNRIRAVRIWLLARTPHESDDYRNSQRYYVVGDQIWPQNTPRTPFPRGYNDGIRRRVLVKTIQFRNL